MGNNDLLDCPENIYHVGTSEDEPKTMSVLQYISWCTLPAYVLFCWGTKSRLENQYYSEQSYAIVIQHVVIHRFILKTFIYQKTLFPGIYIEAILTMQRHILTLSFCVCTRAVSECSVYANQNPKSNSCIADDWFPLEDGKLNIFVVCRRSKNVCKS